MREGRGRNSLFILTNRLFLFRVRADGNEWRGSEKLQVEYTVAWRLSEGIKMIPYFQRFPFSVFIFHW